MNDNKPPGAGQIIRVIGEYDIVISPQSLNTNLALERAAGQVSGFLLGVVVTTVLLGGVVPALRWLVS